MVSNLRILQNFEIYIGQKVNKKMGIAYNTLFQW